MPATTHPAAVVAGAVAPCLLIAGTTSDAGKTVLTAALCRLLARRGLRVAPFKAQNMSLNSAVADPDAEIGRAQALQAEAAGVPAEAVMNPVLLKPSGQTTSHVLLMGRPWSAADAVSYGPMTEQLRPHVRSALAGLRSRFDIVIAEGAGGIAEPNLRDRDLANAGLADDADLPVIIVADIERGGAFASLYGSWGLLQHEDRRRVAGFVLNRFRGDPSLLEPAIADLTRRTGVPMLGVVPWVEDLDLPAEDSLGLRDTDGGPPLGGDGLHVASIRFPRLSNFTDMDGLAGEPGVRVTHTDQRGVIASADLVVLPGSRATVDDLAWLRQMGLADAITGRAADGQPILGICAGYQMLGQQVIDGVEHPDPSPVPGLGLLPVRTRFAAHKVVRNTTGPFMGAAARGYEIRHGRTFQIGRSDIPADAAADVPADAGRPVDDGPERHHTTTMHGVTVGTSLHGILDDDGARRRLLSWVAEVRGLDFIPGEHSAADRRMAAIDRLADVVAVHLDVDQLLDLAVRRPHLTSTAITPTRPTARSGSPT